MSELQMILLVLIDSLFDPIICKWLDCAYHCLDCVEETKKYKTLYDTKYC